MRPLPSGRRAWIDRALKIALSGFAASSLPIRAQDNPVFSANPFMLGVASGCPEPDGVVLWTRLAPRPLEEGGGLDPVAVPVRWEVSEDDAFTRVVRSGDTLALPDAAHSVHIEVNGLAPARWYWYRFTAGRGSGAVLSPVGRTRTAPAPGAPASPLSLAFASCQHWEHGLYGAYRHMVAEALDLIVFLGDYIYESNTRQGRVREHCNPEPTTLSGYRVRYGQYKSDPLLQHAHAAAPWLMTWDDHEVSNDYANDRSHDLDPNFLARRAAAYRAYFEHMPLRRSALPTGPNARIYGRWGWGALADFHVLDGRQYRSHQACARPGRGGSTTVEAASCAELFDPARTMLGAEQERWLAQSLRGSRARWNVIAQQTLLSRFDGHPGPGERYWTDGWSGYPAAADRLVRDIAASGARNPLVIGGDVHANYVCDVKTDFANPESPTVATEFCGTSITSRSGLPQLAVDTVLRDNPHILLADVRKRGYVVMRLDEKHCRVDLRTIDDATNPVPGISTLASFTVEDGTPGARRVTSG